MSTKNILLIVVMVAIVGFLVWFISNENKKQRELLAQMNYGDKRGNETDACSKDWLCATTSILGGIGSLTDGVTIGVGG